MLRAHQTLICAMNGTLKFHHVIEWQQLENVCLKFRFYVFKTIDTNSAMSDNAISLVDL